MSSTLQTTFVIFVVGMLTVFLVLGIVVLLGRSLIWVVNRYAKEVAPSGLPPRRPKSPAQEQVIPAKELAAIIAAVDWATHGQASITKIEKVSNP